MNPMIQRKRTIPVFIVALLLTCVAIPWSAQAVLPPPDGGYPNGNTAEGDFALQNLTTGNFNTALGVFALFSNTAGVQNTATGAGALFFNTGDNNTANGAGALFSNISGTANTAMGLGALFSNTGGLGNTAVGFEALGSNTTISGNSGNHNTAIGNVALLNNTTGDGNTAVGDEALHDNTGGNNTAIGEDALVSNTTGNGNTAIGTGALSNKETGNNNIALGFEAGDELTTGDNNIDIGNTGVAMENNTIRIGGGSQTATFIAGISGANVAGGDPVFILSNGKLGTVNPPSSARFKEEIRPMNQASEVILALKPVTFRYKKEFDAARIPQFGLVAEEVEKVNPDLVKRDREGKVQTVRYEAVNAMLLNEFLKEHRKVEKLEATVASLAATMKKQAAQIQKVSAQLELNKAAPQTVANGQ
jgi:Chaperone of endosialidase